MVVAAAAASSTKESSKQVKLSQSVACIFYKLVYMLLSHTQILWNLKLIAAALLFDTFYFFSSFLSAWTMWNNPAVKETLEFSIIGK